MNRPVNFSKDNLAVRWQSVKRDLKEMDLWQGVGNNVKRSIKNTIETIIWEEFDLSIASKRYQRSQNRQGYRSGAYKRGISTTHGRMDNLRMPKSKGYKILQAYQRRQAEFDEHILKAMILGLSTRKQREFLGHS